MPLVAGHTLGSTPRGHGCVSCGVTWTELLNRRADWVDGADGVAHMGKLNQREVHELLAYEVEYHDWIWRVTMGKEMPGGSEADVMEVV